MPDISLQCHQIACERDGRVLFEGLDLTLSSGDIIQIEGPNGAGKTTFLRTLVGLFSDYSGKITWAGKPLAQVKNDYLSNLLFIGHLSGVKQSLTPRENLSFFASLHQPLSLADIDLALAKVGLYGYEDLPGYQLSAGQQRRVGLARLYLSKAPLWVLDEPFTAIDKEGVSALEALFAEHAAGGGCIVLTTHQRSKIERLRRVNIIDYLPSDRGLEEEGGRVGLNE